MEAKAKENFIASLAGGSLSIRPANVKVVRSCLSAERKWRDLACHVQLELAYVALPYSSCAVTLLAHGEGQSLASALHLTMFSCFANQSPRWSKIGQQINHLSWCESSPDPLSRSHISKARALVGHFPSQDRELEGTKYWMSSRGESRRSGDV